MGQNVEALSCISDHKGNLGDLVCPFLRSPCLKGGCELWVELFSRITEKYEGRCSIAWVPLLFTETNVSLNSFSGLFKLLKEREKHVPAGE